MEKPTFVKLIERSYSRYQLRILESSGYVILDDYRVERVIPEEVHRLLTRILNVYLTQDFNYELKKIVKEMRDLIIYYNDVVPIFKLSHVLLIRAANLGKKSLGIATSLLREIMENTEVNEVKTFIRELVHNIKPFKLQVERKSVLFFRRPLSKKHIIILDDYSQKRVFKGTTNSQGEIKPYLLPHLRYIIDTGNTVKPFEATNTEIKIVV